ncbi:MAG: hypothetical protein AAF585_16990, partial [Verrucomicrobiota bacterium]
PAAEPKNKVEADNNPPAAGLSSIRKAFARDPRSNPPIAKIGDETLHHLREFAQVPQSIPAKHSLQGKRQ